MKFSSEELRSVCHRVGIPLDSQSRVEMPASATQEQYVHTIRALMDLERDMAVFARFAIGDLVLSAPGIDVGCRKAWCIVTFGEQLGRSAMLYSWVARHWPQETRTAGWGWTWYRMLAKFPPEVHAQYVHRFKAKKVNFTILQAEVKAMLEPAEKQIPDGNLIDLADSTCFGSTEYVESRKVTLTFLACECSQEDAIAALVAIRSRHPCVEEQ